MKRLLLLVLLAATVIPLAAPASTTRARLWVPDRSPLVVRGSGFAAHERIVVTVTAAARLVHRVVATRTGSFVTTWTAAASPKSGCNIAFVVRATGNRGTFALVKTPAIECPPGPIDPTQ